MENRESNCHITWILAYIVFQYTNFVIHALNKCNLFLHFGNVSLDKTSAVLL